MANILIVDDNETIREGIAAVVIREGHSVFTAADAASGLKLLKSRSIDFTITDLKMEGMDGIDLLKAILEYDEDQVVMLITAFGTVEKAVLAMKLGAFDFITKPFSPDIVRVKVDQALRVARVKRDRARLRAENQVLREEVEGEAAIQRLVGESAGTRELLTTLRKVAPTDSSVLLSGESGTGKELVARALHELSRRSGGPFIRVNCGALAETLLESELFGHEKGSFTGATRRKLGRFELADQGTIFLDEISEISPALQVKLLRVLQEREFERVGGEVTISVDVRVIAATNQNLEELVERGTFRQDLYFRLHIVPLRLPPLRERLDDVEPLVRHFLRKLASRTGRALRDVENDALDVLRRYSWPGNIRELENVVEQAMVFAEGDTLRVEDLPSNLRERSLPVAPPAVLGDADLLADLGGRSLTEVLDSYERTLIGRAYEQAHGVKTDTARLLGIKTSALYYKLEKYGIG